MATIQAIKPIAMQHFNIFVLDSATQQYFSDVCDAWSNENSYFEPTDTTKIRATIYKYSIHINRQLDINIKNDGYTKINETRKESERLEKIKDGEFKTQSIVYPDGYTGTTDSAFLKGEQIEKEFNTETDSGEVVTDIAKESDILALAHAKYIEMPNPRVCKFVDMLIIDMIKQVF